MCGILAYVSRQKTLSREQLQIGLETLISRGPDGEGIWISPDGQVGLGHRRLAIRDLQGGAQPLISPDGQIIAVVNGELYNSQALRQAAEAAGYHFKTRSDSELALALYIQRGLDFVQALCGEFALIIWDQARQRLLAVRDRFGIKPLYYAHSPEGLMLASKARALLALGHPARWDRSALQQSFGLQYLLPQQSLFAGIRQLPPGHLLIADRNAELKLERYWDLDYAPAEQLGALPGGAVQLHSLLRTAVSDRLEADVPVCAHLSGGIDSSAVLALMTQLTEQSEDSDPQAIQAFTVSFPEHEAYDEAAQAAQTASYLGAKLQQVPVQTQDLIAHWPESVRLGEGLSINGHTVAKHLLNRAIRAAGYRVALTGEGADELLLGYAHFRQELGLAPNNPLVQGLHTAESQHPALTPLAEVMGFVPVWLQAKARLGEDMATLLRESALPEAARHLVERFDFKPLQGRHPLHQSAWLWIKLALGNYILPTVGDGAEMAHGIEGRLPFLDHRLFESLRAVSPESQFSSGLEKTLLREAMAGQLPAGLLSRPKHPFLAPPLSLSAGWRDFLSESFRDLEPLPLVDTRAVLALIGHLPDLPPEQHRRWDPVLNTLLSAVWLQAEYRLSA